MNKTSIFIVDDHQITIEGIASYLIGQDEFELQGSATSATELFDSIQIKQPDILLLDIKLPGLQGFQIAEIISNNYAHIKIVFLSSFTDEKSLKKAIEVGGVGYLSKDIIEEEFLVALNKIKNGESYYSIGMQKAVFSNFTDNIKSQSEQHSLPLSTREIDVIKLFVEGLSYKKIATYLSISVRTVESHKKNILEKLELKTTVDLVKYAIKNGIISL